MFQAKSIISTKLTQWPKSCPFSSIFCMYLYIRNWWYEYIDARAVIPSYRITWIYIWTYTVEPFLRTIQGTGQKCLLWRVASMNGTIETPAFFSIVCMYNVPENWISGKSSVYRHTAPFKWNKSVIVDNCTEIIHCKIRYLLEKSEFLDRRYTNANRSIWPWANIFLYHVYLVYSLCESVWM